MLKKNEERCSSLIFPRMPPPALRKPPVECALIGTINAFTKTVNKHGTGGALARTAVVLFRKYVIDDRIVRHYS